MTFNEMAGIAISLLSAGVAFYVAWTNRHKGKAESDKAQSEASKSIAEAADITIQNLLEQNTRMVNEHGSMAKEIIQLRHEVQEMKRQQANNVAHIADLNDKIIRLSAQVISLGGQPITDVREKNFGRRESDYTRRGDGK